MLYTVARALVKHQPRAGRVDLPRYWELDATIELLDRQVAFLLRQPDDISFLVELDSSARSDIVKGVAQILALGGTLVARPVTKVLGAPLPRLKGTTGRLARENAMRNPRRTSTTASANISPSLA